MEKHIWCLIIPMLLASARAVLHDTSAQAFYKTPQSSSPTPVTTQSPRPDLKGMKEIVLFLTPDQVQTLEAAGAIVQPYPEYEHDFAELQEKFRQSVEHQTEAEPQMWMSPVEQQKYNEELQNYYKLLNIQEINDDLAQRPQVTEGTTEKAVSTMRYKYTKVRHQYKGKQNAMPYVPKKPSRPKTSNQNSNTEYVRFLPNYEHEDLQMVPLQVMPLSPYQYGVQTFNTRVNEEISPTAHSVTNTETNTYTQDYNTGTQQMFTEVNPQAELNTNTEIPKNVFKSEESRKPEAIVEVPAPTLTQEPVTVQTHSISQVTKEFKETLSSIEGFSPPEEQQEKPEAPVSPSPTVQTPVIEQDQLSLLLAPLYQHQAITDTIARQKEELLKSEFIIRNKLQQMKESQYFDEQEFSSEVQKLTKNIGQQNALAKIVASSGGSTPSVFVYNGSETNSPTEFVKTTEYPTIVRVPKPTGVRPPARFLMPISFIKRQRVPKPVETVNRGHGLRNVYVKVEKPYVMQKVQPFPHRMPVNVPTNPEQFFVIRHIWDH